MFSPKTDKQILKFTRKCKGLRTIKTFFKCFPQCGRIWLVKYKDYCKSVVIKMGWYWLRDRPMKWKREPRNRRVLTWTLEMVCKA